jgi:hypothetical protein
MTAGQAVEVRYHEPGMHAATIRVLPAGAGDKPPGAAARPAEAAASQKSGSTTVAGTVTAVTGTSLTVKGTAGESTFVVPPDTRVIGRGLGTQARASAAAGKTRTIGDLVAAGDAVTVTFHETGGAKHAAQVRISSRATK